VHSCANFGNDAAAELLDRLRIDIRSPQLLVTEMSGGQRQMVAAARAIAFQSKILITDEPTAALGVKEANTLLKLIEGLRDQGLSIILITQRIPDVLAIGDRVIVLKAGERQGVLEVDKCTLDDVVELIVKGRAGREEEIDYLSFG
jgi:ABC-type sugar transport system ATPase subunit